MSFPRQQARTRRFTIGAPHSFQISPDGRRVAFLRDRDGERAAGCLWVLELESGQEWVAADPLALGADDSALPPEERARRERLRESGSGIVAYTVDDGFTRAAFSLSGRLFYVDLVGDDSVPTELPATGPVVDPLICPRGDRVAYVSGGALRVVHVDGSGAGDRDRALAEPDGSGVTWGLAEFIAAEEMGRYRGMWWSPDASSVLAARVDDSPVTRWHIADPADPFAAPQVIGYPPAGSANADVSLAVFPVSGGASTPIDWDRAALPYLARAGWTTGPDGTPTVVFSAQSREQRTLTTFTADPVTGLAFELRTESDPVWVELMPGGPLFTDSGKAVWAGRSGDRTERTVYAGDDPIGPKDAYVRGVSSVDGERVLISVSPSDDPGSVGLWLVDLAQHYSAPLDFPGADGPGVHSGRMRGDTLVVQRRDLETDGVRTSVVRNASTETRREVTEVRSFAQVPEIGAPNVRLWSAGAHGIPSALVLPSWYEEGSAPLPVLVDPYGGPHAQRVLRARGAFLTSQWFADQGFAVLIADGRGTPGKGLAWEQEIAGDLAGPVLDDQVTALRDAAERFGCLDLDRVAIRGWSFGGYLAALAVLRRSDVFHAAVAGAPVIDWELYDTHYTERYLGDPAEQAASYRASSLLEDASTLRRPLMLVHGLADDNVVFAHSQRLSSALLAAGRPHTVLPLAGVTHSPSDETVSENLLLLQVAFIKDALER